VSLPLVVLSPTGAALSLVFCLPMLGLGAVFSACAISFTSHEYDRSMTNQPARTNPKTTRAMNINVLFISASPDRLSEDVVVLAVVVPELELRHVQRQILAADLVERADRRKPTQECALLSSAQN